MKHKVLITPLSFQPNSEPVQYLTAAGLEIVTNPQKRALTEAELIDLIAKAGGVDAIIAGLDEFTGKVIDAASPQLKIIAKYGVGYNNLDLAAAKRHNIIITTTRGANAKSVAELTIAFLLSLARNIGPMDKLVRANKWQRLIGTELAGKTLGIIGLGDIGSHVAKRAQAFDMRIIAYDIVHRPEVATKYGVEYLPLDEVIAQADFLSLHAPAKADTIGMLNLARFEMMKPTAFFINTARGDLVVEDDLYTALTQNIIAGAALDVFVHEPLTDSRWFSLPNTIYTPHAGANTHDAVRNMSMSAAAEVVRVLSGQPPKFPLQF